MFSHYQHHQHCQEVALSAVDASGARPKLSETVTSAKLRSTFSHFGFTQFEKLYFDLFCLSLLYLGSTGRDKLSSASVPRAWGLMGAKISIFKKCPKSRPFPECQPTSFIRHSSIKKQFINSILPLAQPELRLTRRVCRNAPTIPGV